VEEPFKKQFSKFIFGDFQPFSYGKISNHPVETTIYKQMAIRFQANVIPETLCVCLKVSQNQEPF